MRSHCRTYHRLIGGFDLLYIASMGLALKVKGTLARLLHLRSADYNVIHNNIIVVTCFVCRSHVSRLFRP